MSDKRPRQAESLTGAHPYRPVDLRRAIYLVPDRDEIVERATRTIDDGNCPRCGASLPPPDMTVADAERMSGNIIPDVTTTQTMKRKQRGRWYPAGSHVTVCRCVPVCDQCGLHESLEIKLYDRGLTQPSAWPVKRYAMLVELDDFHSKTTIRHLPINQLGNPAQPLTGITGLGYETDDDQRKG